ncbi:MAG TPA: DNA polymerase III subunit gamma/tau [Candidatus Saccharimonadales bacterium]|nr:DNA polymerase III subunit gamma/tau [Candidatus Saccharimonadales bacterium]
MVYYRKYRPQKIADLDNAKLRETLTSVLSSNNVPHSFLFTGPKGLGKTSTARIIAKVLNCTNKKGVEPCGECEQCVSITNGNNIDVLEIDGASNRGIDEIRDLRDRVKLAPSSATKKVYIIDEVHMLTTEAFNALLKTIEEPPSHVVFIFATTEPQKVPATIVSRCFHLSLSRATEEEIVHSLRRIVSGEKLDIPDGVLSAIARRADGGFRDGAKILEELVSVAGDKKITEEFVNTYYKTSNVVSFVDGLLHGLQDKKAAQTIQIVGQVLEQGMDIKYFMKEVLEALHELLVQQVGITGENFTTKKTDFTFSLHDIALLVGLFEDAYKESKYAVIPQLPLELAIVAWCSQENKTVIPDKDPGSILLDPRLRENDNEGNNSVSSFTNKNTLDSMLKKERNLKVAAVLGKAPVVPVAKKVGDTSATQVDLPQKGERGASLMDNIIYKVKPYNHSVAGVLRGCLIRSMDGEKIIFETAYKFHKEKLDEFKTKEVLEKALREITGKQMQILIELKK